MREDYPDMTLRFWEVGDVRAEDVRAAVEDPARGALAPGPAKRLLNQLALVHPEGGASLLFMRPVD